MHLLGSQRQKKIQTVWCRQGSQLCPLSVTNVPKISRPVSAMYNPSVHALVPMKDWCSTFGIAAAEYANKKGADTSTHPAWWNMISINFLTRNLKSVPSPWCFASSLVGQPRLRIMHCQRSAVHDWILEASRRRIRWAMQPHLRCQQRAFPWVDLREKKWWSVFGSSSWLTFSSTKLMILCSTVWFVNCVVSKVHSCRSLRNLVTVGWYFHRLVMDLRYKMWTIILMPSCIMQCAVQPFFDVQILAICLSSILSEDMFQRRNMCKRSYWWTALRDRDQIFRGEDGS